MVTEMTREQVWQGIWAVEDEISAIRREMGANLRAIRMSEELRDKGRETSFGYMGRKAMERANVRYEAMLIEAEERLAQLKALIRWGASGPSEEGPGVGWVGRM